MVRIFTHSKFRHSKNKWQTANIVHYKIICDDFRESIVFRLNFSTLCL